MRENLLFFISDSVYAHMHNAPMLYLVQYLGKLAWHVFATRVLIPKLVYRQCTHVPRTVHKQYIGMCTTRVLIPKLAYVQCTHVYTYNT